MGTKVRTASKKVAQRAIAQASLRSLFPEFRPSKFRKASDEKTKGHIRDLREAYLHRGLVLYVGAGVSLSLGLPSWADLIRALSVNMMSRRVETAIDTLKQLTEDQKWELLGRLQVQVEERTESDKPILMMARAVKDELGDRLPASIARTLYRHVRGTLRMRWQEEEWKKQKKTPPPQSVRPRSRRALPTSELLDSIVALARAERDVQGVQAIVNYNFDDLLDEKLREQHVKCRTVLSGRDIVPAGTLPCYHVHGLLGSRDVGAGNPKAQGNFVFSEDEYHAEYSDPYRWSNMTQMSLLGRYTGLFVGLSLEDPNIRRLIDVTHRQYPENLNYAILPRKEPLNAQLDNNDSVMKNLFEEVESKSFEKIGVRAIWVDSFTEIPGCINGVCGADAAV